MYILELSEVLMYEFHYDYVKINMVKFQKFTDSHSLMYGIKTEDVYQYFSNDINIFDFSNYSTKSKYYDNSNKLLVSKIKYEMAGVAIKEFVRLKREMYSY